MMQRFEQVANAVTIRIADLLAADVSVTDGKGLVVASSTPARIGRRLPDISELDEGLLVPISLACETGQVVVKRRPNGEHLSPRLARAFVELVVSQTTVVDRLPNTHQLKNKFIYDLLHGAIDDEAAILREGQILGMDFMPPRLVILIDAAGFILASPKDAGPDDVATRLRAQTLIDGVVDFFELPNDTICAYIGDGEVVVLKASDRRNLDRWVSDGDRSDTASHSWADLQALKRAGEALWGRLTRTTGAEITIGIGRHHPGLGGLASSYQDARVALSLGRRLGGPNQVHCLDSLGIASFVGVANEETKVDLARYLLSPLDGEADLMSTLEAFFAHNCAYLPTARALCIHRNTLTYRLDKIASLTGLDPRWFDDAVQIRLALVLRSFLPETNGSMHLHNRSAS